MKRDNTPCANEISFDVPSFADVDKEYDRAVSMGAKSIMEPTTEPWGYNQFSVSRNIDENHTIPSNTIRLIDYFFQTLAVRLMGIKASFQGISVNLL